MKTHLIQIDNFCYDSSSSTSAAFNLAIYKEELVAVCSPSYLSVDSLLEAYRNHLLHGMMTFEDQTTVSLTKGTPLKSVHAISKHAHLVPALSIADNIFSLRKVHFPHFLYNVHSAKIAAADLLKDLRIPIDINTPISNLTIAENHLLLLAKAFICGAKLIILDNIIEYYTLAELDFLLNFIQHLKKQGLTFLVITNSPSLLTQTADRIFIGRNYSITNVMYHADYNELQLIAMMLGGIPHIEKTKISYQGSDAILDINWSRFFPELAEIKLHRQECFCVFDMNSSNILNLFHSFTGNFPYRLDDKSCVNYSSAIKNGLAPIAFSNLPDYLFSTPPLQENLTIQILKKISSAGVLNKKLQNYCIRHALPFLDPDNGHTETELMKILLLRWQVNNPKVMLLSDLNINNTNRNDIYDILTNINQSGSALIILSSNLYDCLYFADTLLVIKDTSDYKLFHKNDYHTFVQDIKSYLTSSYSNRFLKDTALELQEKLEYIGKKI